MVALRLGRPAPAGGLARCPWSETSSRPRWRRPGPHVPERLGDLLGSGMPAVQVMSKEAYARWLQQKKDR